MCGGREFEYKESFFGVFNGWCEVWSNCESVVNVGGLFFWGFEFLCEVMR